MKNILTVIGVLVLMLFASGCKITSVNVNAGANVQYGNPQPMAPYGFNYYGGYPGYPYYGSCHHGHY